MEGSACLLLSECRRVSYMLNFFGVDYCEDLTKMEMFSLEEDDSNGLFLTQTPSVTSQNEDKVGEFGILGDPLDFTSPCVSLVSSRQDQYSDISEDEFVDIPSSQPTTTDHGDSTR